MSEKSPNFKIEIPSSVVPEPVRKGRKAHRSSLGALYAALQIFGQLASLVICGLAFYYFIENDDSEHTALTKLRMIIGIPYNAYLSQTDEEQYFIIAALSCFALSSFLQLTVFWRAYFSPRFLAKNPSLSVNDKNQKSFYINNPVPFSYLEILADGSVLCFKSRFRSPL